MRYLYWKNNINFSILWIFKEIIKSHFLKGVINISVLFLEYKIKQKPINFIMKKVKQMQLYKF